MNDIPELSGPTFAPASGGAAKQLIIFCHGVGADGADLIGLAPYFSKVLPDAFFVASNAPFVFDMAPFGFQWFSIQDVTPATRLAGVQNAAPILDHFIDLQLQTHGLDDSQLALVGFFQGTMVSLYVGLRREKQMAGIAGYSGAPVSEHLLADEMKSRPPLLLVHGAVDDVVPPESLGHAVQHLTAAGLSVKHEMRPGLGHGLDDHGIMLGMDFLSSAFGVPLPEPAAGGP